MSSLPSNEELKSMHDKFHASPSIISAIKNNGHPKWGFVICRITYSNQAKWDEFIAEFKRQTLKSVRMDEYAALLEEYLEWTVLEDKEQLNGVTMLEASHYFLEWVKNQKSPGEDDKSRLDPSYPVSYPRHHIFIYGCTETIDSMLNPTRRNNRKNGNFFHLVNATIYVDNEEYERAHSVRLTDNAWLRAQADNQDSMYANLINPTNWYDHIKMSPSIVYH